MAAGVALAASGSENGAAAEKYALDYCRENMIDELMVIHVVDTSLSHYGETDQLASGSCKAEFIDYINENAQAQSLALKERLQQKCQECGIRMQWLELSGKPVEKIVTVIQGSSVSKLILGAGNKPGTFFAPKKKTAKMIDRKLDDCRVVIVSPSQ